MGTLWMWSPCIPWAHWSHTAGYILNAISICPLGTFYSHNQVHFECIWFLPTGYIVITYWLDSQCIQHVPTDYWGPCPQCKGRYIGPFSLSDLKAEIGPFQSSPLSLVPKLGKPGKFCLIQNLSHLHNNHPTPSINAFLNSDKFSCTWGTFRTMCTLIRSLPPGTQAATRDIAEAYRIISMHENQWPGVVVHVSNDPEPFALNTSNSFGCATAGGLFGLFGDALADLLCARGIGPILKWVGDFVFIRIPKETIENYNDQRAPDWQTLTLNGGQIQTRGCLWFKGDILPETGAEHYAKSLEFPLWHICNHRDQGRTFPYGFNKINKITTPLRIPWEMSKDIPFSKIIIFAGFAWDLETLGADPYLPSRKIESFLRVFQQFTQMIPSGLIEN